MCECLRFATKTQIALGAQPGEWWPDRPGVLGVRDRLAGGAWLATDSRETKLAVILNREDVHSNGLPAGSNGRASRGTLVLDAVEGKPLEDSPKTAGFNLVAVTGDQVEVSSWNGETLTRTTLPPGVHMVAHHDVDDPRSARIAAWLPEFQGLGGLGDDWQERWIAKLDDTANLDPADDRAIIRDNRGHGYNTLTLFVCTVEIGGESRDPARTPRLRGVALSQPAVWAGAKSRLLQNR